MREHFRSGTEVLDGLRGVAILLVFVFHTWLFSWYTPALSLFGHDVPVDVIPRVGYFGVDLFFVISGFVLFFPHAVRAISGAGSTHGARDFAVRRAIKILPSYAIAFAVTALSLASLHKPFSLAQTFVQHALFINDFFDDKLGYANSVFWSLAIEGQFYVIFLAVAWMFRRQPIVTPVLMVALALAFRHRRRRSRLRTVGTRIPAVTGVPRRLCRRDVRRVRRSSGVRARVPATRVLGLVATLAAFASLACIWLLFANANLIQYDPGGPEKWDVVNRTYVAWSFAALAFSSSFAFGFWRSLIANPVLVFFSVISYNLYLWHTLVMIWFWRGDKLPHAIPDVHSDDHWKFTFISLSWGARDRDLDGAHVLLRASAHRARRSTDVRVRLVARRPSYQPALATDRVSGKTPVKVAPSPNSDSATIVPPCASTICLTIESPSPVPAASRVRERSTT